ncbi:serine/threonine-protein phosphatase 6 regulatory ankyrin repeat subunit B-like [Haliotis asinina]|uniref:serine/threonine-protein phosphatase 6 regulatory ankyrin repeat subunit B-like n=1 Tax=Haliotis asinina TaxID=109174 RepID=UPI003531A4F7
MTDAKTLLSLYHHNTSTDGKQTYAERPPQHVVAKQETFADGPLHDACEKGNLTRVRDILSRSLDDVNRRAKKYGRTPLMTAAKKGHYQIVEFLIRKGANVSHVDNNGDSTLHWACSGGHVDIVKHLLSNYSADINSRGHLGRTPLMTTVYHGHRQVFDVLLELGANASLVDGEGDNVLYSACRGGHVDMVRTDFVDDEGHTILHLASLGGHVEIVKNILSQNMADINATNKDGDTAAILAKHKTKTCTERPPQHDLAKQETFATSPLHDACKNGNLIIVRHILFQSLVDINRRDIKNDLVDVDGHTILHLASLGGRVEMVKYILSHNMADINATNKDGDTAAILANQSTPRHATSAPESVDFLCTTSGIPFTTSSPESMPAVRESERPPQQKVDQNETFADSPLHDACKKGDLNRVRYILSRGLIDVSNRDDSKGRTSLMVAVQKGHERIVEFLLRKGANVSQVDNNGHSVLHWACSGGYVGLVKHLLSKYSIDINKRDRFGRIPLMSAVYNGHKELFDVLVGMGANVSIVDANGDSILHSACRGGHVGMVKHVLASSSVDINSRSKSGKTPLMITVYYGYMDLLHVLVGMGANVSHVQDDGDNILHWACRGGHVDMVKHIISNYGVDINSRDMCGRPPLMTSVYFGYTDIFKYLVSFGANVSYVDDYGDNILHRASTGGHAKMVQYIISQNMVDINSRGRYGRTPLMIAAHRGRREAFDVLVNGGSLTDLVDDEGHTTLHLACLGGRMEIAEHIISQNMTDFYARDKAGKTAAIIAKHEDQPSCFKCLP